MKFLKVLDLRDATTFDRSDEVRFCVLTFVLEPVVVSVGLFWWFRIPVFIIHLWCCGMLWLKVSCGYASNAACCGFIGVVEIFWIFVGVNLLFAVEDVNDC